MIVTTQNRKKKKKKKQHKMKQNDQKHGKYYKIHREDSRTKQCKFTLLQKRKLEQFREKLHHIQQIWNKAKYSK